MSIKRFHDEREHRLTISLPTADDPTLIVCPKCRAKGLVLPLDEAHVKAVCTQCTYVTTKSTNSRSFAWYDDDPTDGYFGYELWLKTDCNGHSLWAFNLRHLNFLETYVAATLRERSQDEQTGWRNSSLASRLPKWLKSSKNRNAVIKAINELKQKNQS